MTLDARKIIDISLRKLKRNRRLQELLLIKNILEKARSVVLEDMWKEHLKKAEDMETEDIVDKYTFACTEVETESYMSYSYLDEDEETNLDI